MTPAHRIPVQLWQFRRIHRFAAAPVTIIPAASIIEQKGARASAAVQSCPRGHFHPQHSSSVHVRHVVVAVVAVVVEGAIDSPGRGRHAPTEKEGTKMSIFQTTESL